MKIAMSCIPTQDDKVITTLHSSVYLDIQASVDTFTVSKHGKTFTVILNNGTIFTPEIQAHVESKTIFTIRMRNLCLVYLFRLHRKLFKYSAKMAGIAH